MRITLSSAVSTPTPFRASRPPNSRGSRDHLDLRVIRESQVSKAYKESLAQMEHKDNKGYRESKVSRV
jgi:hypothetical protein